MDACGTLLWAASSLRVSRHPFDRAPHVLPVSGVRPVDGKTFGRLQMRSVPIGFRGLVGAAVVWSKSHWRGSAKARWHGARQMRCGMQSSGTTRQPRACVVAETVVRWLLRVVLGVQAQSLQVRIAADSSTNLALGRIRSADLRLKHVRRGFWLQRAMLRCEAVDLGIRPLLILCAPLLVMLRPALLLPVLMLVLFLPGLPSTVTNGKPGNDTSNLSSNASFRIEASASDLDKSRGWRFLMTAALRDIMEYSIAGQVALPREVSGELSSATSFELEAATIVERRLVMDAVARLPDGVIFRYRLRTGVKLLPGPAGSTGVFWEDPEIRVAPGWPLPEFWAPLGGFAGRRFDGLLRLTCLDLSESSGLVVEGSLNTGGSDRASASIM